MSGTLSSDILRRVDARDLTGLAADAIFSQTKPDGTPPVQFRTGIVAAVDYAAWRVDVLVAGATTAAPDLSVLSGTIPAVGESVVLAQFGGGYSVIGQPGGGQTGWIDLAPYYINGWVDYGGTYRGGQMLREGRWVYLRGLIRAGTATTMLTLPPGFRPVQDEILTGDSNSITTGAASASTAHTHPVVDVGTRVQITSAGVVSRATNSANGYQSFGGVYFAVD